MAATYAIIEGRIQKAIDAINTRENPNRAEIAREFRVPYDRLRSRLRGYQSKTAVRELHNRALKPDQESALRQYLTTVNQLGLSARLHMVQSTANVLRAQDFARWNSSPLLNVRWVKRWLDRQSDLFKAKRKSLAAERKNAHDSKVLQTHFDEFKEVMIQYDITKNDTWNFDEIDYRMSIARFDWVVTVDSNRRIYFKNSNNRESLTNIECISEEGKNISSMLIMTEVQLLTPHFNNDLDDDVLITISDTGYSNDWISLRWLKHFDRFSQKHQKGAWRMLVMNDYESHHTREFLSYCENHKIIPFDLPSHTTHLLQPLDVCVFQSLKHWHSKAINRAVQMSDEIFSKVEFLTAFNEFRTKVFKESTIRSAWKHTDLISFDSKIVLNKVQIIERSNRPITSSSTIDDPTIWKTSTSRVALENQLLELTDESTSEEFTTKLCTFWKDANAMTRKMKLLQNQLSQIEAAENARKARKKQSNKVLKIEDILYVKDARSMTQDRQKLEDERQQQREEAWEKRYLNALKKCYRATKPHRAARIKFVQAYQKKWRVILKQLLKNRRVYNG